VAVHNLPVSPGNSGTLWKASLPRANLKSSHLASKSSEPAIDVTNTKLQRSFPAAKRAGTDLNMALLAVKGADLKLKRTEMVLNWGGLNLNCPATQMKEDETEVKRVG